VGERGDWGELRGSGSLWYYLRTISVLYLRERIGNELYKLDLRWTRIHHQSSRPATEASTAALINLHRPKSSLTRRRHRNPLLGILPT
jgi:hypothetical protein